MIQLKRDTVSRLKRWASKYPNVEVCGMVWEHPTGEQTVWALQNTHPEPDRYYRIDPHHLREAYASMDEGSAVLLGFYHSHPGGKPDPSEEDMAGALNVGIHYLIVYPDSVMTHPTVHWQISAWDCIETGILVEDAIEVLS